MSDPALAKALERKQNLLTEISSMDQRLKELRDDLGFVNEWIAAWYDFAGIKPPTHEADPALEEHSENIQALADVPSAEETVGADRHRTTGNPKKEFVSAQAREIIKAAGEPVPRADLFKLLANRGVIIEGKDPEQVLSTMLWRTRDEYGVVRMQTGGYWLAEKPHPASGYEPADTTPSARVPDDADGGPSPDDLRDAALERKAEEEAEAAGDGPTPVSHPVRRRLLVDWNDPNAS